MKKVLLCLLGLLFVSGTKLYAYDSQSSGAKSASIVNTSTKRTIHVAKAGTLPDLISESEEYTIEELTLTGELNGTDFRLLRDMAGRDSYGQKTNGRLKVLDFSGTKIVHGGANYLNSYYVYNSVILPQHVFQGCNFISVKISNSVTSIGDDAFYGCSGLASITIPGSVTSIGNSAFSGCSGLTSITIPSSVTSIGDRAFSSCSGLTSITISNSVASIGDWAFYGCSGLTSITIPNSVASIGNYAFSSCSGLTSITISSSVTSIGNSAFSSCSGLTSITIPSSVTSIGNYAFNCSGLTSIKVESGNKKYDSRNSCNAIIETSSNTLIAGCKTTTIPNSVTSIGNSAFYYCSGLTSITIPNSVTSIGDDAFRGCSGLTSITIPSSVTSIGNSAFGYCSGLTSITIPNSVTSIGNSAFEYCSSLISIVSEIVKPFEIESNVFSNYSTPALIVPKGTKSAYQSTAGWNKFTNIVEVSEYNSSTKRTIHVATAGSLPNLIPNSEKYIIEELTLTGELNGTDFRLLRDMAGKDYNGQKTNGRLKVLDFSGTKIVAGSDIYAEIFGYGGVRYSYTIERNDILPQSVFAGCNFISVKISNSVTGIRIHAFDGCNGLTSVTIPNSVRNIFDYAFSGCSGLTSITIPSTVTYIGDNAFSGCRGLTSISIPSSVTSIGSSAFSNCSGLTSITIPSSVTSIEISAFRDCSGLTSLTIPSSVTSIGEGAFYNCSGLTSIVSEIVKPFAISEDVFSVYSTAKLTVPKGSKTAYQSTNYWNKFSNIVESTSQSNDDFGKVADIVDLGLSVKWASWNVGASKVGDYGGLYGAGDPTGQKTSTNTGNYYFKDGESICGTEYDLAYVKWGKPWRMPTWSELEELKTKCTWTDGVVDGVKGSWVKSPNGNSIFLLWAGNRKGSSTFSGKGSNGYYWSGDMGVSQHKYGYKDLDIKSGGVSQTDGAENYWGQSIRPVYGDSNKKRTIHVATAGTLPNLISESEKYNIEELTLTGKLNGTDFRLLRDMAGCNYKGENTSGKLTVLDFSSAKIVAGGDNYIDANSLAELNILFTITHTVNNNDILPQYVFAGCKFISVKISNSVTSIGNDAFNVCSNLASVTIPNSVTSIGNYAFSGCSGLTSITIPSSVTSIGNHAFNGCSNLKSITIPSSVTSIGINAFYYCTSLTSIIIPNSVTSIGNHVFAYCKGLTSITLPSHVTSIGDYAFLGCSGLASITLPSSVTSIGDYAFYNCSGLTSITIPSSVTSIGDRAFENCSSLTSITIPSSLTSISYRAFANCIGLTSITIPNSVTSIGNAAFLGSNALTSIIIPNSVTSIGSSAFQDCSGLTSITIPNSVTSISNYAFYRCSGLTSIVSEITKPFAISESVFSDYSKPTLTVPSGTKSAYQSTAGWKKFTNIVEASSGEWREVTKNFDKSIPFKKIRVKNKKTSSANYCCVFFSTKPNDNTTSDTKYNINFYRLTIGDGVEQDDYKGYIYINTCKSIGDNWYEYEFKQPVYYSHYQSNSPTNQLLAYVDGTSTNDAVTVTAKSNTREYGDDNPSFEYTVSGGSISGTPKITCSATKTSSVGTYTIKIEKGSVNNSNVTFVDGTLTITKAPLTITAKSYTRKQGESNPTFDVTYSGFKNSETASVLTQKPTCSTTATSSSSPGTYDITVSGASATNYDISYVNGKLTVTQADAVIVTAINYTREYGEDNPKFSYTTSGAVLTGTPSITCSATKTSPVGTYPIKIVQGSVSNYNVTYVDGTLTITKAPLTITAKSYTRKQGESNPTFDVTYSGFKNGENASVLSRQPTCITTAVSSSPPGTYDIIASGASATNYDISYVKGVLTVTQADAVIVTAKSYTREYGEENPVFDYTTSGGSLNGTPTIICSATRTSPVGTYPIKITQGSGRNYNVTYVDGTLTITKAPLIITAKSYKREEGTANPTLEATYNGFKNGETESVLSKKPTLTTTATIDSKPGDYPITASGAEARNYQISYMSGKLTVTEKNEVKFTSQGVSYIGTNATRTAEIEVVASDITELEIPQSVINDGKTYQVTSVSNGALSNRKFNYVSLPSTITSLNANTFYNSVLGALVWKADASLSSNVFSYMAMPTLSNFLLYVNSKSYAPSNVTNVVVGNTASNIVLVDGTNTWFYCPMAFTAQSVTYTHHYGMLTGGNGKGWETISLPYDVQKIEHKSKGVLTPFVLYNDMMTQRPFWLYEFGSNGFRKTDVIKANTPYIIAMPNDSKYDEEYILVGDVTFSATNAQIHKTESLVMPSSNDKTFVPAFTVVDSSSSVYALNVNNNMASYAGSYDAGSRFISNLRDVYPFEAYMTTSSSSARTLGIDFADGTTGIDEIPMAGNGERVKVYSLSGLLLIDSEQSEWESLWQQLPSGVYIVNGKKTIK